MTELNDCKLFLWKIRFALHSVITRYDNRLLFDRQISIAKLLGYQGDNNESVEKMMSEYYRVVHTVTELNKLVLSLFKNTFLDDSTADKIDINEHFISQNSLLDIKDHELFEKNNVMILSLFYTLLQNDSIKNIHPNAMRSLRSDKKKMTSLLSQKKSARELFLSIIKHPNAIKKALVPMHQLGILAIYLPTWQNIVGLMQFDLFHSYTVDEHTIRALIEIDELKTETGQKKHPNSSSVLKKISKPELLIIACLYHDIAKGQKGDHSILGAKLADDFCKLHEINDVDSDLISWLVRHHLLMSVTAQHRDLQDPQVIESFAHIVESRCQSSARLLVNIKTPL